MDMINMQNQAKEWLSRIKDKVRYYDIQASVKSKKNQEKEMNIILTSKNSGVCSKGQT